MMSYGNRPRRPKRSIARTSLFIIVFAAVSLLLFLHYHVATSIPTSNRAPMGFDRRPSTPRAGPSSSTTRRNTTTKTDPARNVAAPAMVQPKSSETVEIDTTNPRSKPKAIVAYAVSLTSCGEGKRGLGLESLSEGAAVLKHSIHLSSHENPFSGSKYGYKAYAFVHPQARSCSGSFSKLGFEILERPVPFNATEIQKPFLREHIVKSGCCGDKEYLKLYSYTLFDHPVVVHLDLDSLVLKPLDDLFDVMLDGPESPARKNIPVMFDAEIPETVDAFFTRDYNMVNPSHKHVGVQGGFLVVRPSQDAFDEYIDIVLEGRFFQGSGWDGLGYGGYFGAQQIQGICSYFYDHRHPGTAVEINRCYYNAMVDDPRGGKPKNGVEGTCRDGREKCEDCREANIENIKSAHFTVCQKPWTCPGNSFNGPKGRLCKELHNKWFSTRRRLDEYLAEVNGKQIKRPQGNFQMDTFLGYCKGAGKRGYTPLEIE